jgi:hypothetical protein
MERRLLKAIINPAMIVTWLAGLYLGSPSKKRLHATEQDRPDVAQARECWKASQASLDPTMLVFVDETGANTKMVRRLRTMPKGQAAALQDPVGSFEDHDLHLWSALRRSGRPLGAGRSHDRRGFLRQCREGARPDPFAMRHSYRRQSCQPSRWRGRIEAVGAKLYLPPILNR